MSLVISGNHAHITSSLVATIVGLANNGSGGIRVQTGAPHLFATSDYVAINTVEVFFITTYFTITVIDATHFDLNGSTYTVTDTGTATDTSLTPQIQVPTDGDTFSLQLSGMLSALQALADRTQYLRRQNVRRTTQIAEFTTSGGISIPPGSTHLIAFGCGGGGGGGGSMQGLTTAGGFQNPAGGGGAGAPLCTAFVAIPNDATSIDVVIGAGGAGGIAAAQPGPAGAGAGGSSSTIAWSNGSSAGVFSAFHGAEGGGGASNGVGGGVLATYFATISAGLGIPVYTPGGFAGPSGFFRSATVSKGTHYAPGPSQMYDILVNTGNLNTPGWDPSAYNDPIGRRDYSEGGASMANAGSLATTAVSYDGCSSLDGNAGGSAGTPGTTVGSAGTAQLGGAAGGGGGGGAFGIGANGGDGGNASAAGTAGGGSDGFHGAAGGGGGGGAGAGGGTHTGTPGDGAAGGIGGTGLVWVVFLAAPTNP